MVNEELLHAYIVLVIHSLSAGQATASCSRKLLEEDGCQRHMTWVQVLALVLINCGAARKSLNAKPYFLIVGWEK